MKKENKPVLVVLAAGLGSRYGSLKQMDHFGPSGETIVDYAIYDAIAAGFDKIVFVIRKNFEEEFKEIFGPKMEGRIKVAYVYQELENLPAGLDVPAGREKPWGTGHAVMMAASEVDQPFAIVNADDFYGRTSFDKIIDQLKAMDNSKLDACLVGFVLKNTLSDHGRVSRGVCKVNDAGCLDTITERTHIYKKTEGGAYYEEQGQRTDLTGEECVSMNLMGFTSKVFDDMEDAFVDFYHVQVGDLKAEFFIPTVLDNVRKSQIPVTVLTSTEQWFGVTYKEDKPIAQANLKALVQKGVYPNNLWATTGEELEKN
ncbi:sugar phosphate nucleotidyltransferase [Reichenbachiella carrageenanivorans]|uniref:Sugar phosphate nucleotidyltransferase n=1 Tax=Reichenbachiella carrageenanivorans TaxID=2979869 RepID=A0ABY6DBS4_9BACT|nr:sugar phosphate nucleotidyltransferase [Reichenbachiella carrageenanivorans]UXX81305.1 sugar phosphate nucleotidyltransferase [Reichenbachiella carrageenanivorans]